MSFWTDLRDTITSPVRSAASISADILGGTEHALKTVSLTAVKPVSAVFGSDSIVTQKASTFAGAMGNSYGAIPGLWSDLLRGKNILDSSMSAGVKLQQGMGISSNLILGDERVSPFVRGAPLIGRPVSEVGKVGTQTDQNDFSRGESLAFFRGQAIGSGAGAAALYGLPALAGATGLSEGSVVLGSALLAKGDTRGAASAFAGGAGIDSAFLPDAGEGDFFNSETGAARAPAGVSVTNSDPFASSGAGGASALKLAAVAALAIGAVWILKRGRAA